jgi:hypothetical protein
MPTIIVYTWKFPGKAGDPITTASIVQMVPIPHTKNEKEVPLFVSVGGALGNNYSFSNLNEAFSAKIRVKAIGKTYDIDNCITGREYTVLMK